MPRLNGSRRTDAPRSTTTMSKPGSKARISSMTRPTVTSSLSAGTIAIRLSSRSRSDTRAHRSGQPDQLEDLARTVRVRVLVEDALACAPSHLLGGAWIRQQFAVRRERFVGRRHDAYLRS